MKKLITTLLIVRKNNKLLLAQKKRGFGVGKINGCGGKCNVNESIEDAMVREANEELNITPINFKEYGIINFEEFVKGEECSVEMHVFLTEEFLGVPTETEEMSPIWVEISKIPYENMFKDDSYWLPLLLKNKHFTGNFKYDSDFNIISYDIKEE